jgi:futalosine hydrolase
MILALAATEIEMEPLLRRCTARGLSCRTLVGGVGLLEAAVRLSSFLHREREPVRLVINFGIAGAYDQPQGFPQPQLLDLCLASREVFGDFGLAYGERIEPFPPSLAGEHCYDLDPGYLERGYAILEAQGMRPLRGTFVTVAAASATAARGRMLRQRWTALCENMEGAAVVRACREFSLPVLEVRAISNRVEDRDPLNWQLSQACERAAEGVSFLLQGLSP